jgi:hypothetical protein
LPLLSSEPFLYPDNLFQSLESQSRESRVAEDHRWWVVHARARAEKSLARAAAQDCIPFFLPLHQHRWRKEGRRWGRASACITACGAAAGG